MKTVECPHCHKSLKIKFSHIRAMIKVWGCGPCSSLRRRGLPTGEGK